MSNKEEVKEENPIITTDGGYRAIVREGLVIRASSSAARLTEDNETFAEYKERLRAAKWYTKQLKKGNIVWNSRGYQESTGAWVGLTYVKALEKTKTEE